MAAYRRVYDSRHLQADCQEPGSAPTLGSWLWATFTFLLFPNPSLSLPFLPFSFPVFISCYPSMTGCVPVLASCLPFLSLHRFLTPSHLPSPLLYILPWKGLGGYGMLRVFAAAWRCISSCSSCPRDFCLPVVYRCRLFTFTIDIE